MINTIRYCSTLPSVEDARAGDIVLLVNSNSLTLCTEPNEFKPLIQENKHHGHQKPTNCKNCGAVLTSYKCEYCGTEY